MSNTQIKGKGDYENLKASKYSYERYMTAKYYKNLTESQYSTSKVGRYTDSALKRETLNPAVNLKRLRDRIATTEAIAKRYTLIQKDWLRLALERVGGQVWKYKFNYIAKFVLLYKAYHEICNYRYLKSHTVLPGEEDMAHFFSCMQWSGISIATFLLI